MKKVLKSCSPCKKNSQTTKRPNSQTTKKMKNKMGTSSVILHDLAIGYPGKVVAEHLNGAIKAGELTCLLGRNGVGKSTLLRTLAAFQPSLEGSVRIEEPPSAPRGGRRKGEVEDNCQLSIVNCQLDTLSDKALARLIGVVLTEKPDVRNMTSEELVGMGRSPYTGFWGTLGKEDKRIVDEAIQLVGIEALRERFIHTLSDGERQKVMIAKALAQQTPIIYLDEPTAFLDFPSKVEVMQLLHQLAHEEGKTIFLSTHDVELSLQMADCIWLMESEGLTVGTPRELADMGALSRFIEHRGIAFDAQTLTIRVTT